MVRLQQFSLVAVCLILLLGESVVAAQGPTKQVSSEEMAFARRFLRLVEVVKEHSVCELTQRELIAWAIEGLHRQQDRKMPVAIQERLSLSREVNDQELALLLRDARLNLGFPVAVNWDPAMDEAVALMLQRFDSYAQFIKATDVQPFRMGGFVGDGQGIGIRWEIDAEKKCPRVVTPIKGGPAHQAGIKTGDVIIHITRKMDAGGRLLPNPDEIATEGLPLEVIQRLLLSRGGNKIELTLQREGEKQPLKIEVTHGRTEIESILGSRRKPDDSWDYFLDPANKIGYLRITQFNRQTIRDLKLAIEVLTRQDMKGLVLDLRSNPGGLIMSATEVADLFIDNGTITTIFVRKGQPDCYTGKREGSQLNFPMACLINRESASASEIVAACLQDHRRALIVGERSQGKGSVQNILPHDERELMLSIAVFLRPNGRKLDPIKLVGHADEEWGVLPDPGFELKLPAKERADLLAHLDKHDIIPRWDIAAKAAPAFQDRQREMALEYLRTKIRKS